MKIEKIWNQKKSTNKSEIEKEINCPNIRAINPLNSKKSNQNVNISLLLYNLSTNVNKSRNYYVTKTIIYLWFSLIHDMYAFILIYKEKINNTRLLRIFWRLDESMRP